jgi:uncharacterized membrane protein YbhN (UPF0104 family)
MIAMRRRLLPSASAAALVALMFTGAVTLWVGVPVAWLWIGSRLQAETGSVGTALGAMMAGMVATIVALTWCLGRLNRRHIELQELRGHQHPEADVGVLERVLVLSAAVAVIAFCAWFLVFSGSEPFPLKLGY